MIITSLDGTAPFYRAHTPEWASQPLSGAGAARHGGRLNRPGLHALYLAASQATAIAEYQQLAPIMPPLTLVTYHVQVRGIVDFRGGYDSANWSPLWQELSCNWRRMAMIDAIEPPSWVLADEVLRAGKAGVLFPSLHGHGINLVIYTDALGPEDRLAIHDPRSELPHDRSSWA